MSTMMRAEAAKKQGQSAIERELMARGIVDKNGYFSQEDCDFWRDVGATCAPPGVLLDVSTSRRLDV